MKISELADSLAALSEQLTKVQDEILFKIAELEAALDDVELPDSAIVALDSLRQKAQALDDIVPDADAAL